MFKSYDRNLFDQITSAITIDISDISNLVNNINNYGVCVITNVLNNEECNNIIEGLCNDFSHLTANLPVPFDINNKESYSTLDQLLPTDGLIYQYWGIGQSQTVWNVRTNDKIIDIFRQIYSTNDLLVSFDAVSFHIPPETHDNKSKRYYSHDRWHFDQSLKRNNAECIQSWVNAFNTDYDDATTCFMIYSNKYHQRYANYLLANGISLDSDDFIMVNDENINFFITNRCIPYRVKAPKGSLVLWDSRTLHFGSKPLQSRLRPNYRMLIYLCYTPSSLISESNRKRKIEIMNKRGDQGEHRMTTHWPHKPKMFGKTPRLYGNNPPIINPLPSPIIPENKLYLIGIKK